MSSVGHNLRSAPNQAEDWRAEYTPPALQRDAGGLSWGLLVTGLVIVGVGALAWNYLGPDLKRYLKMSSM